MWAETGGETGSSSGYSWNCGLELHVSVGVFTSGDRCRVYFQTCSVITANSHHLHGLWKWPQTCLVLISPTKNIHLRCPVTAVLSPFIQSDDCPGLDHSSITLAGFGLVSGHHENCRVSTLSGEQPMSVKSVSNLKMGWFMKEGIMVMSGVTRCPPSGGASRHWGPREE